jgi:hypothetical protein
MLFNVEKCKVMHMGYSNKRNRYEMDGRNLEAVREARDLGAIVQEDFIEMEYAMFEGSEYRNRVSGTIKRSFYFLSKAVAV